MKNHPSKPIGFVYSPLWKITHQKPSVLCTPPFEKSPIKAHWFCVLPPLKNHPSKPIGFMYSPLWKITHQSPSVLYTPPFEKSPIKAHRFCVLPPLEKSLFLVGVYFGKYGIIVKSVTLERNMVSNSPCTGCFGRICHIVGGKKQKAKKVSECIFSGRKCFFKKMKCNKQQSWRFYTEPINVPSKFRK